MLLSGRPCIITPLWEMAFPRVWNLRLREVQGLPEVTETGQAPWAFESRCHGWSTCSPGRTAGLRPCFIRGPTGTEGLQRVVWGSHMVFPEISGHLNKWDLRGYLTPLSQQLGN